MTPKEEERALEIIHTRLYEHIEYDKERLESHESWLRNSENNDSVEKKEKTKSDIMALKERILDSRKGLKFMRIKHNCY